MLLLSLLLQPLASACCNTSPGALASRITLRHQRNIKCNIRHQLFACSLCFAQIPFLPSTLSLATLPPSSKLLTSSVSNPKYPCKLVFPSSRGPHSLVRYRSPSRRWCGTSALGLSLRRPKEQLEGQAVVSCRCTVQLRGTGTGSMGCECECVWSLQYLIHHVGERDIPPSRPFGRHPGHVRTGIAPKPNR
ncbi:hypothetical protein M431DRAFT_498376 [Trichoderma harzianum CBS 226.95]|uniref:Uncharacterized protein n=1 Tax=Trichoderma harzianum CBS 226.95 TaxID=983964 RepID=A0A2T4A224_TRIHA|nr:hypothetical protein M431DRAFT_498376 [Trichoderma harzianum CBS 226.95]PTB51115.1 hypothetical protein M431DRAFT_498376 [Trichoderma harzianum CBS 226.95]